MNQLINYFRKRPYLLIVLLWLAFETVWYLKFGLTFKMEAHKYIEEARYLLDNHHLSQGRFLFYLLTILVIAVSFVTGIGLHGALLVIALINLTAYLYFFKALRRLFGSVLPALMVVVFLIVFWPYQIWSLFLYTECLFYSLVMILFSRLLLFEKMTTGFLAGTLFVLMLVVLARPLGILFIFPVLLFLYFHFSRRQKIFFYIGLLSAALLLVWVVQVVFTTTHDWNMQRAFMEESIICDVPVHTATNLDISNHPNQLYRLGYYITHNFSHFINLAATRLKYFFLMTRSYYSTAHNAYVLANMLVIYLCMIGGIRQMRKIIPLPILVFSFSTILFFALAVAFQCDDYHNRFILTLMPLFTVLALAGCMPVLKKIFTSFSKQHKG